jgi:hypothetical protein
MQRMNQTVNTTVKTVLIIAAVLFVIFVGNFALDMLGT